MLAGRVGVDGDVAAERAVSLRLLAVLIVATALGPMAMQIFLPALPSVQTGFGVDAATAQLTLSLAALSIAVATLFYGPLSDRVGRRPALLGGLVVYLVGSVACALATSMGWLILGRVVQAAGGCAGIVLTRAIVRDLFDRERSASVLAYVTMAMVSAPMMAPVLGGILTDYAGWRSLFVFGGVVGLAVLAVVALELPETAPARSASAKRAGYAALDLLRSRAFCGYALQGGFSMAVFFSFLGAAPYLMVTVLGRPASEYGFFSIVVSGAFMLGNFTAGRFTARVGSDRMIVLGSVGSLAGAAILLGLVLAGVWSPLTLFLPTAIGAFSQGLSMPNAQAAVVSVNPAAAGSASGLAGFLQMGMAGLAAQVVGSLQDGTPYPMAVAMTVSAAAALAATFLAIGRPRVATHNQTD